MMYKERDGGRECFRREGMNISGPRMFVQVQSLFCSTCCNNYFVAVFINMCMKRMNIRRMYEIGIYFSF